MLCYDLMCWLLCSVDVLYCFFDGVLCCIFYESPDPPPPPNEKKNEKITVAELYRALFWSDLLQNSRYLVVSGWESWNSAHIQTQSNQPSWAWLQLKLSLAKIELSKRENDLKNKNELINEDILNISLAAKGALALCLQHLTTCLIQNGRPGLEIC